MKFRFTDHAKYRLFLERDISTDAVKSVILEPDSVSYLPDGSRKCVKRFSKGELAVVYAKDKNVYIIITAYYK